MKKRNLLLVVFLLITILLFTTSISWAAGKPVKKIQGKAKFIPDKNFIEIVWLWEITKTLNLNEEKLALLLPKLKELNDLKEKIAKEKKKLIFSLRKAINENKDTEITQILRKMDTLKKDYLSEKEEIEKKIRGALTLKEWAQFILLQEEFPKRVKVMLDKAKGIKK